MIPHIANTRFAIVVGIAAAAGFGAATPLQLRRNTLSNSTLSSSTRSPIPLPPTNTSSTSWIEIKPSASYTATAANTRVCNNSPALCARSYANITHLGAHDSAFIRDAANGYNSFGDQSYNTTVQLDAGVRLLSAQVHLVETPGGRREWHLCHTTCILSNAGTLSTWLAEVRAWLDAHPTDVVTVLLVNADNASAADLAAAYTDAGIAHYGYVPPASTPKAAAGHVWPTLNELVDANTRLVSFVADLPENSAAPYLLDEFANVFESAYENYAPADFSCVPDRPAAVAGDVGGAKESGMLFLMNHFLYWRQAFGIDVPDIRNVNHTNGVSGVGTLGWHLMGCQNVYGTFPTFVLVDFFERGPAVESVDWANGVHGQTSGRREPLEELQASIGARIGLSNSLVALVVAITVLVVLN